MKLSDQQTSMLKEHIAIARKDDNALVAEVAVKFNTLPLLFDMGGWFGIDLEGNIVSAVWDDLDYTKTELDPRTINIALFQGRKRYPDLSFLEPVKKPDHIVCPACDGAGTEPFSKSIENVLCFCGGLGWVPNGSNTFILDDRK